MDDLDKYFEMWEKNLVQKLLNAVSKEEKVTILYSGIVQLKNELKKKHFYLPPTRQECQEMKVEMDKVGLYLVKGLSVVQSLAEKSGVLVEFNERFANSDNDNWGSGPNSTPIDFYYCANIPEPDRHQYFCENEGKLRCKGCMTVAYCSKKCQVQHWPVHKSRCKSMFLAALDWQPMFIREKRAPNFPTSWSAGRIPIWANTPAFDVMNWKNNELEGLTDKNQPFNEPINIVLAAPGDFHNLIETIASVPTNVAGPLRIVINDKTPLITARNFFLLFLLQQKGVQVIDTVVALWYSAFIVAEQYTSLSSLLSSKFDDISALDRNCVFENGSCRLILRDGKPILRLLLKLFENALFDLRTIIDRRKDAVFNSKTIDAHEAYLSGLQPLQRCPWSYYVNYGAFVPFGGKKVNFNRGNPFLFDIDNRNWLVPENSHPIDEWRMDEVVEFGKKRNLPTNDLIGCLFFYIRDHLAKVVHVLQTVPIEIEVFSKSEAELVRVLKQEENRFDRINLSNFNDENNLGVVSNSLKEWSPLLNGKNKSATLITLFKNWNSKENPSESQFKKIRCQYGHELAASVCKMFKYGNCAMARGLLDDSEEFKNYLEENTKTSGQLGVVERKGHKIVPYRLFAPVDAPENYKLKEEELYYGACVSKCSLRERFVEWQLE